MKRRALAAAAILVASAALPGCIAVFGDRVDPIHADKLAELERRMDRVESNLPKQP